MNYRRIAAVHGRVAVAAMEAAAGLALAWAIVYLLCGRVP